MKTPQNQFLTLIIWDEVPMQLRHLVEAVDRTCRDILDHPDLHFGGIRVEWGGDFQKTLPVVSKGNKEELVSACIQISLLWHHVKVLHLTENMHVDPHDPQSAWFSQWLSDVGQGKDLPLDHSLTPPQHMICGPEVSSIISVIYPTLQGGLEISDKFFLGCAILCPEILKWMRSLRRCSNNFQERRGSIPVQTL